MPISAHSAPPAPSSRSDASHHEPLELDQLRRLRVVSVVEALTLIVLVAVAVPLKHLAGRPRVAAVMGPVHGLAFLAYLWTAVETVAGGGWSRAEVVRLFATAVVPFGGFANGALLRRRAARLARAAARNA